MGTVRTLLLESLGKTFPLEVPEKNLMIHHKPQVAALPHPRENILQALSAPIGTSPLRQAARGGKTATVVVDDWARSYVSRRLIAPLVLDELNAAGIPDERITVVMARGLGLAPSAQVLAETYGPELISRPVRRQLSALHKSGQQFMGFSSLGTPVWIDRAVTQADFVVGIGATFPSRWGGWSGGAKIIVPGVAASETIWHNHQMMLNAVPGRWDHPGLVDREEIAQMVGLKFLVNVVANPDGEIAAVAAGECRQTHRRMGDAYFDLYRVPLPRSPDVVVTTVDWWGGRPVPMDSLYGFVDQSLAAFEGIANPGATIILAGCLPGGILAGLCEYMRTEYSLEDLANLLYQSGTLAFVVVMLSIRFKMQQAKYRMIAATEGADADTLLELGFETAPSVTEAVQMALAAHGQEAQIAVLPALGCPNWPVIQQVDCLAQAAPAPAAAG